MLIPPSLHLGVQLRRILAYCLPRALGSLVSQDVVKAGPNALDGFPGHLLRRGFRAARERGPHVGVDKARVDPDDVGALGFELDTQTVGQGERRMFGSAVRRIERIDVPTHDREHVDDHTATVVPQHGRQGLGHRQHAEDIHLHLAPQNVLRVLREDGCGEHRAGVVDEDLDVAAGLSRRRDISRRRHVKANGREPRVADRRRITCTGIDLGCTRFQQGLGKSPAEASIGLNRYRNGRTDEDLSWLRLVAKPRCNIRDRTYRGVVKVPRCLSVPSASGA